MGLFKIRNVVSLTIKYNLTNNRLKIAHYILNISLISILLSTVFSNTFSLSLVIGVVMLAFFIYFVNKFMKFIRSKLYESLDVRQRLLYVLRTNNFFTTSTNNEGQKYVDRSATLSYLVDDNTIVVRAHLTGDSFSKTLKEGIDLQLSSALGLELEEKRIRVPRLLIIYF